MRPLGRLALAFLVVVCTVSSAQARVATIETTAPLQDHAEQSIRAALLEAVETAVKGAVAMGLTWVKLSKAVVHADQVTVQIMATDTKPEGEEEEGEPGGKEKEEDAPASQGSPGSPALFQM